MIALYIILGIIAAALVIAGIMLLITYCAYRKAFYSSSRRNGKIYVPKGEQYQMVKDTMFALIDELKALPFEEVCITSHDGIKLYARYYHVADGAPLQIQFHGYRGTALRDFCGGNKIARESGFNTLLVDQRAHGKSDGNVITFGIRERYDCLDWVNYAVERFADVPIYLAGVSMGAATVLMASELNLPKNVKGIVADCPYSSPAEIIKKVCTVDLHLPKFSYKLAKLGAKLFGHFDLEESSATSAVKNSRVPILIIHGKDDRFVPCDMSKEIASQCNNARLVLFDGAGHGLSYLVDPEKYKSATARFISATIDK